jgi:hypothetical protein
MPDLMQAAPVWLQELSDKWFSRGQTAGVITLPELFLTLWSQDDGFRVNIELPVEFHISWHRRILKANNTGLVDSIKWFTPNLSGDITISGKSGIWRKSSIPQISGIPNIGGIGTGIQQIAGGLSTLAGTSPVETEPGGGGFLGFGAQSHPFYYIHALWRLLRGHNRPIGIKDHIGYLSAFTNAGYKSFLVGEPSSNATGQDLNGGLASYGINLGGTASTMPGFFAVFEDFNDTPSRPGRAWEAYFSWDSGSPPAECLFPKDE